MIDAVEIVTTLASDEHAAALVDALVESGLCACVKRTDGVRSTYYWQGDWHTEDEVEVRALSLPEHVLRLTKLIASAHPYDVPEVLVRSVALPHDPYAEWVVTTIAKRQTRPVDASKRVAPPDVDAQR
ncbi:conserved hypothetical protein involved in tolerance to divalent cations [Acidimicrobium ferrooxidans DSM 10331]|uniref:CutA1 divalent ion tolerance protein n=1 Tax=Acidimicrobium ferrooxidans (strain DSM 10331 / JCM 15462 / NBRC 103882 / ICP) TaxID=525909 RepID=C7M2D1_ACIFD|nr:divalent-cation tolerance protein CutA [Acidimicrobium ferrooxidans]ACU54920.1 conserved hypothetical protein involved in tolerance to divalent cations [Acidimicrobium ferrooxidans DSM 10331]